MDGLTMYFGNYQHFVHQTAWGWMIAVYLFLGGLGGAMGALSSYFYLIKKENNPVLFGLSTLLGIGLVNFGGIFLLIHMLKPWFAFFVWAHPTSWIFWGASFIMIYTITGAIWGLSLISAHINFPFSQKLKNLNPSLVDKLGYISGVMGLLTAVYTGLLLSTAPAITLWSNPGLPVLFMVSALSTATAYFMLVSPSHIAHENEKLDIALLALEIIIISAFFNYLFISSAAGKYIISKMLSSVGFMGFFVILGLLVPFLLEIYAIKKHSKSLVILASLLVLMGGFLLRFYILKFGYYTYPW